MKPKFIISKSKVLEQFNKIKNISDIVSYSSKTNPRISTILEDNSNCLFSVHLKNELVNIKDKSRVIFLAQAWSKEDILKLIEQDITKFVIDNIPDLDILIDTIENLNTKIDLFLRVKLRENTIKTEKYFVFGIDSETVNKKLKELRPNKNINNLGIHFHRKTQNISEWDILYEISNMIEKEVLEKLDMINIGGGIPSKYANTNENVLNGIFKKILEFKDWINQKNIKLIIEPGRFIAAPACKLVTSIKRIYERNIIIDVSVYNTDLDALIVPVKLLVENETDKDNGSPYVIKGKTPCSLDLFRYRVYLKDPKEGDTLTFLNAGAYNFTTNFCNLEEIETEIVD